MHTRGPGQRELEQNEDGREGNEGAAGEKSVAHSSSVGSVNWIDVPNGGLPSDSIADWPDILRARRGAAPHTEALVTYRGMGIVLLGVY